MGEDTVISSKTVVRMGDGFLHQLNLNQTGQTRVPVPDSKHIGGKGSEEPDVSESL